MNTTLDSEGNLTGWVDWGKCWSMFPKLSHYQLVDLNHKTGDHFRYGHGVVFNEGHWGFMGVLTKNNMEVDHFAHKVWWNKGPLKVGMNGSKSLNKGLKMQEASLGVCYKANDHLCGWFGMNKAADQELKHATMSVSAIWCGLPKWTLAG